MAAAGTASASSSATPSEFAAGMVYPKKAPSGPLGQALKSKLHQTQAALAAELRETQEKLRAAHAEASQANSDRQALDSRHRAELQARATELRELQNRLEETAQSVAVARARDSELSASAVAVSQSLQRVQGELAEARELKAREEALKQEAESRLQLALFDADAATTTRRDLEARLSQVMQEREADQTEYNEQIAAGQAELDRTRLELAEAMSAMERLQAHEQQVVEEQQNLRDVEVTLRGELEMHKAELLAAQEEEEGSLAKSRKRGKSRTRRRSGGRFVNPFSALRVPCSLRGASARRRSASRASRQLEENPEDA